LVSGVEDDGGSGSGIESQQALTAASLLQFLSRDDVHRLEQYGRNLVEYSLVLDIVPALASLFLARRMPEVRLSSLQCAILVAVGCQHRSFDEVAADFNAPASQLLALFNKAMHKLANHCKTLLERQVEDEEEEQGLSNRKVKSGEVLAGGKFVKDSLLTEQNAAGQKVNKKLTEQRKELLASLKQDKFAVAPSGEEFAAALGGATPHPGSVSVKKRSLGEEEATGGEKKGGKKQKW